MQQMFVFISLALLASVAAGPAVNPALFPSGSPFGFYPGSAAPFAAAYAGAPFAGAPWVSPLGAPLGASPLAISSSQRLDYFNQFNAAFAPTAPGRILAANPFSAAGPRFIQPTRFIAAGVPAQFFV
ncbi:uncharacterized protein LOC119555311 [Drosophila subpulchrella]|uniref:uncharacterized protein LOC119555311 n=1 Tax=Drosophila subpulchrella TaxID=1486046 RepID=UPI0018A17308|nr:uncharacterized protein LOC119555311 [Drosophila subpulchrella]